MALEPSPALSIAAAAGEVADRPALVVGDQTFSYAELARRVEIRRESLPELSPSSPLPLLAEPTLEAIVTLYAAIEAGRPVALLHPRWPEPVRAAACSQVAAVQTVGRGQQAALALVFTSGTTGPRKLVELSRAAFLAAERLHAASLGWQEDDRWLLALPFAHVGGLAVLLRTLIARRTAVVSGSGSFDADLSWELMGRAKVTLASLVPAQLEGLLERRPPPSLRAVLLGGAPAPRSLLQRGRAAGWPLINAYGLSETCAQVAQGIPARPLPGVRLRVVEGRIEVASPTLFSAYHGPAGATRPIDAEGFFRTSDLGELDGSGGLAILGRADEVIVSGGEKINPAHVEAALLAIPGVRAASVIGLPDARWGALVAAAVVLVPGLELDTVKQQLETQVASYERPRRYLSVVALPDNGGGKVDRRAVRALFA